MIRVLFALFFFSTAFSAEPVRKTVCLNMIVKDESPVIARCLSTVKSLIDFWVIVDTGSTDTTMEVIKKELAGIPGELHERPWVNFGHNRNEALQLAKGKGDYVLFIDADEVLNGVFNKEALSEDVYLVDVLLSKEPYTSFRRALLIKNSLNWTWQGVIHEKLDCGMDTTDFAVLEDLILSAEARDGNRAKDPEKYLKDALVLEKALEKEPENADYWFYLAQSYQAAGKMELALKSYEKRAAMDGWDQQTFWSRYSMGVLQEHLGMDEKLFVKNYSEAYVLRPSRGEPLFRLAQHFFNKKNYLLGYAMARLGFDMPIPGDLIYIEHWMYTYGLSAIMANCALKLQKYEEAATLYERIAALPDIPNQVRKEARETRRTIERLYIN